MNDGWCRRSAYRLGPQMETDLRRLQVVASSPRGRPFSARAVISPAKPTPLLLRRSSQSFPLPPNPRDATSIATPLVAPSLPTIPSTVFPRYSGIIFFIKFYSIIVGFYFYYYLCIGFYHSSQVNTTKRRVGLRRNGVCTNLPVIICR